MGQIQSMGQCLLSDTCKSLKNGAPGRIIRRVAPHPFGAAVAARRRCLAPAALGSNLRSFKSTSDRLVRSQSTHFNLFY